MVPAALQQHERPVRPVAVTQRITPSVRSAMQHQVAPHGHHTPAQPATLCTCLAKPHPRSADISSSTEASNAPPPNTHRPCIRRRSRRSLRQRQVTTPTTARIASTADTP